MKKILFCFILIIFTIFLISKNIKNSKHNLSFSGTGGVKTSETTEVCIFCHTSHTAGLSSAPLWNREKSSVLYDLYESSTLQSSLGQPDGTSKLCLSCHDGNIAIGHVLNRNKDFTMSNTEGGKLTRGNLRNLGKDISDDHPVSFDPSRAVASSPELIHPLPEDKVIYDKAGKVQCTTCHNPHDDTFSGFLRKDGINGALCKSCHQLTGFNGTSTHDISPGIWKGIGKDPWPHTHYSNVAENSCLNCHRSHNAKSKERLLASPNDSGVCLVCHNGNTGTNIKSEIQKNHGHNVEIYNNIHDPSENILSSPIHTQCADCHDPHRVNSSSASAPNVNGRLNGVSGMNIGGSIIAESQFEYEVCFKCHGQDRYNNPVVTRQDQNSNLRVAFLPSNASFHGVATQGTAYNVPSLRTRWHETTRLYCTDCHNNNNSKKNGGSGPNGPHGSTFEHILERRYLISTNMPYQQSNYDLCWKCHRPEIILGENFTTFKYHKKHIDEESTPCSVCHDPHGSQRNAGLINFDTSAVFPNLNGELKFEVVGDKGYCYLQCHGEDHSPEVYNR